jgi:hypothetical protein
MNSVAQKCCFLMLVLTLACDPGMTIHQEVPESPPATKAAVGVRVKRQNLLIGETHYLPIVEIENRSDMSIMIASSELVARAATFQSKSFGPDSSNLEIAPGESRTIKLWFDLSDSIRNVFHDPAELRIHYRSRSGEQVVSITIVGGPLQKQAH